LNELSLANKKNGADRREGLAEIVAGPSPELVDRYEELRHQALGEAGRGLGMVVFLRDGMKAWMDAWMNETLLIREPSLRPAASISVPQGVRDEAILVLAEMALRVQPEVNPW
jgi:hypothetical protein